VPPDHHICPESLRFFPLEPILSFQPLGGTYPHHTLCHGELIMPSFIRIGVLISGSGSNLQAIMDACASGGINGQIVFVGSDNPAAFGLQRAIKARIATFVVDYATLLHQLAEEPAIPAPADFDPTTVLARQKLPGPRDDPAKNAAYYRRRAIVEAHLLAKMAQRPFDLLVLAGFMRNLSPYFIDKVNTDKTCPRIMNIHPSLLPAFPGVDGYGDTFRYGCKVGGCTVHFVDYGADTGPIIAQKAFAIHEHDTLETVRARGLALEWELYPRCIQLFAQGRLRLEKSMLRRGQGRDEHRSTVRVLD
jgi:phosphoribosylglycinamide formyltransferase-1